MRGQVLGDGVRQHVPTRRPLPAWASTRFLGLQSYKPQSLTVSRTIRGLDGGEARRELVYLDTPSVEADQFVDDDGIEGEDTFASQAEAATYESVPKPAVRPVVRQRITRALPVTVDAPHTVAARRVLR